MALEPVVLGTEHVKADIDTTTYGNVRAKIPYFNVANAAGGSSAQIAYETPAMVGLVADQNTTLVNVSFVDVNGAVVATNGASSQQITLTTSGTGYRLAERLTGGIPAGAVAAMLYNAGPGNIYVNTGVNTAGSAFITNGTPTTSNPNKVAVGGVVYVGPWPR